MSNPLTPNTERAFMALFETCKALTEGPEAMSISEVIIGTIRFLAVAISAMEEQEPAAGQLIRLVARLSLSTEHKSGDSP